MNFVSVSAVLARPRLRGLLLAVAASALAACGAEGAQPAGEDRPLELARAAQPIFGGQLDVDHPEVMFLFDLAAGAACTGTHIRADDGSGFLLTAAHCVTEVDARGDFVPVDPERLVVVTGEDFSESETFFPAEAVTVEPGWDGSFAVDDIAVVRFALGAEPPPPSIEPLTLADDELAPGSDLLLVGYGTTDEGGLNTERRQVERDVLDTDAELVAFSQEDGRGACFGDSGGPGLIEVDGQERVALVISGGISDENEEACATGFTLGMRVSGYADFIADALED